MKRNGVVCWPRPALLVSIFRFEYLISGPKSYRDFRETTYLKFPLTLQILTIAVLSILLTAPTGAVGIAVSGPRLLRRSETKEETGDKGEVEPILDGSNPQMDSTV